MATKLMTRKDAGLRPARCVTRHTGYEGLTVHYHGASPWTKARSVGGQGIDRSSPERFRDTTDHQYCAAIWRSSQAWHMDAQGGCDIFYNSGTCPHGVRFEGRGPGVRSGAQGTTAGNTRSVGVQYIAGLGDPLTNEAKHAFYDEAARYGRPLRWGHRDWKSTACPGDPLYDWRRAGFPHPGGAVKPAPRPAPKPPAGGGGTCKVNLRVLRRGMSGGDVRSLQVLLQTKASQKIAADGVFGPATEQAVRNVQRFFRLPADGIVGAKTWPTLFL